MPDVTVIKLGWDLPHPPAKVWRALTDPAWVERWMMKTDMPARIGVPFTFQAQPVAGWDGVIHSEILELEPLKRLRYTWKGGPGALALDTVVTWTLSPQAGGTRLELEHAGFQPGQGHAFGGARAGWDARVGTGLGAALDAMP